SPFGRFGDLHDLEFLGLGLFYPTRGLAQRNCDLFNTAVAQIERVCVALAAVSDDGDLFALDQVQVGVAIVVNTHGTRSSRSFVRPIVIRYVGNYPAPVLLGRNGSWGKSFRYFVSRCRLSCSRPA